MNETLTRALSGTVYVAVMWFGTSYSETSFSLLFGLILLVSLYEMWKLRKGKSKLLGFGYVLVPLLLVQLLGMSDSDYPERPFNPDIILLMFVLTWTFDTFAYLVGRTFGKHRIAPKISPKKSWEGFAGGWAFAMLAAYLTKDIFITGFDGFNPLVFAAILPFTATAGDFLESHFKRQAGVKDSGNFIPGHGGMLDRMDAFMITIPILYLYLNII
jgi:phosphatidate cytidylyltransferase